jgi:hypothetical protein
MINSIRKLPDHDLDLRDSRDFIFSSYLARKALQSTKTGSFLPNFLNDLIEKIYRMAQSCQMPEFTDHGLPHLCSLIDRISAWSLVGSENNLIIDRISQSDAAKLLIAVLIHDLGMLSHNALDLPDNAPQERQKYNFNDIASWVRSTHVYRLENLFLRVIQELDYRIEENKNIKGLIDESISIASAHSSWPWDWTFKDTNNRKLAAIVAVTDLLDEDSARCDTMTLIKHRHGNELNLAHWIRHCLTEGRINVSNSSITVNMTKPPGCGIEILKPVYSALRNHFKLLLVYNDDLKPIGANFVNIDFSNSCGVPNLESTMLNEWNSIKGFGTENALAYQLLTSFMSEARNDMDGDYKMKFQKIPLEGVDLSEFHKITGTDKGIPKSLNEKTFHALKEQYD